MGALGPWKAPNLRRAVRDWTASSTAPMLDDAPRLRLQTRTVASIWGITPRQSVERECGRIGAETVVSNCIAILRGDEIDEGFLFVIGGPGARNVLDGREGGVGGYWPRTWAVRALSYVWDSRATAVVLDATTDESWRVREMAAKVIALHRLDEGLDAVLELVTDPVARVREAAARARRRLTEAAG